MFEEGSRVVDTLGMLGVVLPRPEDEIKICGVLLNKEKPSIEILETRSTGGLTARLQDDKEGD